MTSETEEGSEQPPFNPEEYSLEEILKPQHSALVVIDMQNDFLHPDGFFAQSPTVPAPGK